MNSPWVNLLTQVSRDSGILSWVNCSQIDDSMQPSPLNQTRIHKGLWTPPLDAHKHLKFTLSSTEIITFPPTSGFLLLFSIAKNLSPPFSCLHLLIFHRVCSHSVSTLMATQHTHIYLLLIWFLGAGMCVSLSVLVLFLVKHNFRQREGNLSSVIYTLVWISLLTGEYDKGHRVKARVR